MKNKTIIAASLLAADFAKLGEDIEKTNKAGCEWLHFDVMDGHFVNNISFGIPVLKSISNLSRQLKDVHLMIEEPEKYYKQFIDVGADLITFHYEAVKEKEIQRLIDQIKDNKTMVGISIKPKTNVEVLIPYLHQVDLILVMSVEPGFGGQLFDETALEKIKWLKDYCQEHRYKPFIQVDGGINSFTAKMCVSNGANVLVAGSYLFSGEMKEIVKELKNN